MHYYGFGHMNSSSPLLIIFLVLIVLSIVPSIYVNSNIKKFKRYKGGDLTAGELCEKMLLDNNITDVKILTSNGSIGSEYYDPSKKQVVLSVETYNSNSISAQAIAAHEIGHAIQHNINNPLINFRNKIARPVSLISNVSFYVLMIGMFVSFSNSKMIINIGIFGFLATFLFQVLTLPIEFDASNRALKYLYSSDIMDKSTLKGAHKVLRAAALTYVAAAVSTLLQIIRLILINSNND